MKFRIIGLKHGLCFLLNGQGMKLGIIVNPNSRYNKCHPESVRDYSDLGGNLVEVHGTRSPDDVTAIVQSFKDREISFIGISGGDGTIHQVLTRVIHVYGSTPIPPIFLLGDGTMNNIAHSVGIRKKGRDNLKKFLRDIETKELLIRERSTMKIDDKFCFLFGCGMTSNFLVEVYKGKKGYIRNLEIMQKTIHEAVVVSLFNRKKGLKLFRPLDGEIFCDGEKMPLRHMLVVLAGTVEEVGMGFRPLYLASEKKGHFHLIATDLEPKDMLFAIGVVSTGNGSLIRNPRYCNRLAQEILIRSPDPFDYTMDGDLYTADRELHVSAGPEIKFVVV